MIPNQITDSVLALPERDRLELAKQIVESVATDGRVSEFVSEGMNRIEEIAAGRIRGLSEEEFREAIG